MPDRGCILRRTTTNRSGRRLVEERDQWKETAEAVKRVLSAKAGNKLTIREALIFLAGAIAALVTLLITA